MRMGLVGFNVVQKWGSQSFSPCSPPNGHTYASARLTNATTIHVRDGAKLHRFAGRYWLLGGWWHAPPAAWNGMSTTNEVWSSEDLVSWRLELAHDDAPPTTGPNARWRRRHNFGSCVLDGYLWVIGGDHVDAPYAPSDVWRSRDGVTWEIVADSSAWGPKRLPIVGVYRDAIHVLGGQTVGDTLIASKEHWSSADGVTWTKHDDMPFRRAGVTAIATLCDKLFIVGGCDSITATRTYLNDTWAWNGSRWIQQSASAPWPGRLWNGVVAYDGKLWVCSGRISDTHDVADCWYSEDLGRTWESIAAPWPPTHADGIEATEEDGIVLASGYGLDQSTFRVTAQP